MGASGPREPAGRRMAHIAHALWTGVSRTGTIVSTLAAVNSALNPGGTNARSFALLIRGRTPRGAGPRSVSRGTADWSALAGEGVSQQGDQVTGLGVAEFVERARTLPQQDPDDRRHHDLGPQPWPVESLACEALAQRLD